MQVCNTLPGKTVQSSGLTGVGPYQLEDAPNCSLASTGVQAKFIVE